MVNRPPQRNLNPDANEWARWVESELTKIGKVLRVQGSSISGLRTIGNNALSLAADVQAQKDDLQSQVSTTQVRLDDAFTWSRYNPTGDTEVIIDPDTSEEITIVIDPYVPTNPNAVWYQVNSATGEVVKIWEWVPNFDPVDDDDLGQWHEKPLGGSTIGEGAIDESKLTPTLAETIQDAQDKATDAIADAEEAKEKALEAKNQADSAFTMASNAVTGTRLEYALSGRDTAPTTGWSETYPPSVPEGEYVWRRTIVSFGDKPDETLPAERITGDNGEQGAGLDNLTTYYKQADATGVVTTVATNTAKDPRITSAYGVTSNYLINNNATYPVPAPTGRTHGTALWRNTPSGTYSVNHRFFGGLSASEWQGAKKGGMWVYTTKPISNTNLAGVLLGLSVPANQWTWVPLNFTATSSSDLVFFSSTSTDTDRVYIDGLLLTDSLETPYFDGSYAPSGYGSAWNGTPNNSTSKLTITTYDMPAPTTNPPDSSWSTVIPEPVEGKNLWRTELTVLTDESWFYSTPIIQPVSMGKEGVSVTEIKPFYALISPDITPFTPGNVEIPAAPWVATPPPYDGSLVQWTTNRISYSDGNFQYTPAVKDEAYGVAAQALTAANRKSSNWYGPSAPTVAQGLAVGDSWFNGNKWQTVSSISNDTPPVINWRDMTPGSGYVDALNIGTGTVGNLEVGRLSAVTSEFDISVVQKLIANDAFITNLVTNGLLVAPGNLILDPGFNNVKFWDNTSYIVSTGGKDGGKSWYRAAISAAYSLNSSYGSPSSPAPITLSPRVRGGISYRVSAWIQSSVSYSGDLLRVGLYGTWYNESGSVIGGSRFFIAQQPNLAAGWFEIVGNTPLCPTGASRLVITVEKASGWTSAIRVSNVSVTALVGGVQITEGAITADKITASEDLSAKVGQFLVITTEQLTGKEINGGVITGATVQTVATSNRGIKMNSSNFTVYTDTGLTSLVIDSTTGLRAYKDGVETVRISPSVKNSIAILSPGGSLVPLSDAAFGTHANAQTNSLTYNLTADMPGSFTAFGPVSDPLEVTFTAWGTKAVIDWSQQWGVNRGDGYPIMVGCARITVNGTPLVSTTGAPVGDKQQVPPVQGDGPVMMAQAYLRNSSVINTTPGQTYTIKLQFAWITMGSGTPTIAKLSSRMIRVQQLP